MCFFISLVPATFWLAVGYFILYCSTRADGGVKTFGKVLAIWIFILAAFIPFAGAYVTIADLCPLETVVKSMLGKGNM